MSRFMILVILSELAALSNVNLRIVYSEAQTYYPTQEQFNQQMNSADSTDLPHFLTTDVENVVTTSALSSLAMQGYPALLVVFPTFNYRELSCLVFDVNPQTVIAFHGKPHDESNDWRMVAIKELNNSV